MSPLKAGDMAPTFALLDQDGGIIHLNDFASKRVLIYFYPKAMTPGCTVQACALRDNMDKLKALGVEILGISTDPPQKLFQFHEKELLNHGSPPEMPIIRFQSNLGFGVKKILWVKNMMGSIASVFSLIPQVK